MSTNFWKQKVCWYHPAMFCLIASSKFSCQWFEFSLKVMVMGSNPCYLLKSFLLYIAYKYIKNTLNGCKGFGLMHQNKLLHQVYQDLHPKDLTNLYMVRNRVYRNRQWFYRRPILHAHLHHPVDGHIQLVDQFVSQRIMKKGLLETTFSVQSVICK